MTADEREIAAQRLRVAINLFADGEALMRQNLRRRYPNATDSEIEAKLDEWLSELPGADFGDADGTPGTWPRGAR